MRSREQRGGVTPFQREVYDAIRMIPKGRVATYRQVAAMIGCRSARAVGQALKRNPFAPAVPCHRVIASDMTLGGFQGKTTGSAVTAKEALLRSEGVFFVDGRLADKGRLWQPSAKGK